MGKWSDLARATTEQPGVGKWSRMAEKTAVSPADEFRAGVERIKAEKPDVDTLEWKEVLKSAVGNVPGSALEYGKGMIEPIKHPIKTAKAIGTLAAGGAQKLIPGQQSEEIAQQEQAFDAVVEHFKGRYGSVEGFKKTVSKDPVGVLADVATLLIPGGQAVKGVGVATKAGKIVKAGEYISKTGAAVEPGRIISPVLRGTGKLGTKALSNLPGYSPSEIYESAAKFSTKLSRNERAALAQSALDRKIPASVKGLQEAEVQIRKYRDKVDELIEAAADRGGTIDTEKLLKHFPELEKEASLRALSGDAKRGIDKVRRQIVNNFRNKKTLTIKDAQAFKQNTYKDIESYYSATKHSPMTVKAQKATARAAREELEVLIPEIKSANKNWGELVKLQEAMTKVANRVTNRDLMGIGMPIKAIAGGTAGGVPGLMGGIALGIIDAPTVKSRIAILLNKLEKQGLLKESSKVTAIRLGLYQSGKSGGAGGEF